MASDTAESRIAELERENAGLSTASDEAAALVEELAAENARLRVAGPQTPAALVDSILAVLSLLRELPTCLAPSDPLARNVCGMLAKQHAASILAAMLPSSSPLVGPFEKTVRAFAGALGAVIDDPESAETISKPLDALGARSTAIVCDMSRALTYGNDLARLKASGLSRAADDLLSAVPSLACESGVVDANVLDYLTKRTPESSPSTTVSAEEFASLSDALAAAESKVSAAEAAAAASAAAAEDLAVRCSVLKRRLDAPVQEPELAPVAEPVSVDEDALLRVRQERDDALSALAKMPESVPTTSCTTCAKIQAASSANESRLRHALMLARLECCAVVWEGGERSPSASAVESTARALSDARRAAANARVVRLEDSEAGVKRVNGAIATGTALRRAFLRSGVS